MKLYPLLLAALLAAALSLTGCRASNDTGQGGVSQAKPAAPEEEPEAEEEMPAEEDDWIASQLDGLTPGAYDGLVITAVPDRQDDLAPGGATAIAVTIANTGDDTVIYTQGSGSYQTPQALLVDVDGLQTVIPQDQLGMATMDFVTRELAPGEEEHFTVYVLGTQRHEAFDNYTHDLFGEEETYIADLDWDTLQERYPDLAGAQAGTYTGSVYFRYTIYDLDGDNAADGDGDSDENAAATDAANDELLPPVLGDPTGYSQADFTITIA